MFASPVLALLLLMAAACERPPGHATPSHPIKVASLVPAATDLVIGMGAGDHLIAVSNWDADRPEIAGLPKVGDYRSIDWERLTALRPDVMIVQFSADKMPAGLQDRAEKLGIKLLNVRNNSLNDLYSTLQQLGRETQETDKAAAAASRLRDQLDAVRAATAKQTPVATLITRSEPSSALACVGGGNYLDEVLSIAGGKNVLAGGENSYPTIDREKLIELNPQVVLVLLPGASDQVIEQTRSFWRSVPQVRAVQDDRVYIMTEPYLLLPGLSIAKVAEQFAQKLHPTTPAPKTGER